MWKVMRLYVTRSEKTAHFAHFIKIDFVLLYLGSVAHKQSVAVVLW